MIHITGASYTKARLSHLIVIMDILVCTVCHRGSLKMGFFSLFH